MRSKFTWIMALLMALTFNFSFAQEKTVSGTVSDDAGPLPGAGIVVKGTSRGTQTDLDGKFSISVRQGEVLEFSFLGYKTQAVTVGASNTLNIVLANETREIDAVQLDMYRKVPVSKAPYAIATITSEALEDRANANVLQSLQGQFAGLNIGTGSGQPGADSTILMRGVGSINGNVEPLFIVDNMPVDEDNFRNINPNDIASVTVLRDAAATAIYGNRGAQGVIVVYTKRGRNNEKTDFRYTTQFGFSELQPLNIELMNSSQLLSFQNYYGQGLGSTLSQSEREALARRNNTYWADVFFRKGVTKSHDLSISSGNQNTTNFMSLNYFEQDGIFLNTNLKRFTLRNNFNGKSSDGKFTYGLNMNASFSRNNGVSGAGSNSTYFAPFTAALRGAPYLNPYNPDGSLALLGEGLIFGDDSSIQPWRAPLVILNSVQMNTLVNDQFRLLSSFNASYEFIKNVTASVQLGADYVHRTSKQIFHPESILGPYQVDAGAQFGGFQAESTSRDFRFNSLASLGYANTFAEKHNVSLTGFVEYNKSHLDGIDFEQRGLDPRLVGTGAAFIAGTTQEVLGAPGTAPVNPYIPTIGSTKISEGLFSYFGNLEYDYDGRFGFAATLRRDASFRFIQDNQWGTFWSVSGSWNIDQEKFMEGSKINQLRLRASYGINGNQRINNAQWAALNYTRSLYTSGVGYNNTVSTVPLQLENPDLRWETTAQTNFGLDFGAWNNRFSGTLDVYRKFTSDLYTSKPISPITADNEIDANIGTMENEGIELNLRYYIVQSSDWQVMVNANASYNRNKIRELPATYEGIFNAGGSTALVEGKPIGTYYVQRYAGVNPANGNPLFYTADNGLTEVIRDADRVVLDKGIYPYWQGGFGTNISYKGFEFSTQWALVADLWRNNLDLATLEEVSATSIGDNNNRSVTLFNAWQNPGDITTIPRVGNNLNSIDYINGTDRYLESGSYLRMRNASLGYTFSKEILKDTPITGLRFFVQGENLVTFSTYRGWDAEGGFRSTDRGEYPTPRIYTIGAVINF